MNSNEVIMLTGFLDDQQAWDSFDWLSEMLSIRVVMVKNDNSNTVAAILED